MMNATFSQEVDRHAAQSCSSVDGEHVRVPHVHALQRPGVRLDRVVDGADVALVPSSDWKGIDPQHGQMAIMNAVAAGLPLLRPVRAATSFASDAYGRVIGSMRWDAPGDGVLVVDMPNKRVPTLYARTGEIAPLVALAFIVMVGLRSIAATHAPRIVLRPALGR